MQFNRCRKAETYHNRKKVNKPILWNQTSWWFLSYLYPIKQHDEFLNLYWMAAYSWYCFQITQKTHSMLWDNCPAHSNPDANDLTDIKLLFFPTYMTSVLQPGDQGIINNLRLSTDSCYKNNLLWNVILPMLLLQN